MVITRVLNRVGKKSNSKIVVSISFRRQPVGIFHMYNLGSKTLPPNQWVEVLSALSKFNSDKFHSIRYGNLFVFLLFPNAIHSLWIESLCYIQGDNGDEITQKTKKIKWKSKKNWRYEKLPSSRKDPVLERGSWSYR